MSLVYYQKPRVSGDLSNLDFCPPRPPLPIEKLHLQVTHQHPSSTHWALKVSIATSTTSRCLDGWNQGEGKVKGSEILGFGEGRHLRLFMAFCENNFGYGIVLSPSCKTKQKTEIVRHLLTALHFFSWPDQPTKIQFQITCSCRPPKQKTQILSGWTKIEKTYALFKCETARTRDMTHQSRYIPHS